MAKYLLILVLILAFLVRVVALDLFPIGFTPDEASFGYDAYSIIRTGKDQWGRFLPIYLESFGDFKLPLYSYLAIPTVAVFGLTKLATRLPNALLGTFAVLVTYFLSKELLEFWEKKKTFTQSAVLRLLPTVAALMLAASPWHIQLSRGAFEANLTTFILPLGVFLFLRGLKKPKLMVASAIVLGINLFSYHSARLVTPVVLIIMIFLFRRELLKINLKITILALMTFAFFVFLVFYTFTQGSGRRVQDVSIFRGALEAQAEQRLDAIQAGMSPNLARLFHNKYLVVAKRFIDSYKQYFSREFLFASGPREPTYGMVPGIGVLYWFELPLLLGFVLYGLFTRFGKVFVFILLWIIVSAVPPGLTTGVGFAGNRAAAMVPAIQIATALGFVFFYEISKNKLRARAQTFIFGIFLIFLLTSFANFLNGYFIKGTDKLAKGMLYGNLESAYWLATNDDEPLKIVVSRKISEPHIYIAFAKRWDPTNYQLYSKDWNRYKEENLTFLDQLHSYELGKYTFETVESANFGNYENSLLVGRREEFLDSAKIIESFGYHNSGAVQVVATDSHEKN